MRRGMGLWLIWLLLAVCSVLPARSQDHESVDDLFRQLVSPTRQSPEAKEAILEKLEALKPSFTVDQNERYTLVRVNHLGARGEHMARVALAQSTLPQIQLPTRRARFLYELIDGYSALGQYENALKAMNESIVLLPALESSSVKIVVLQGAINLLSSLQAYDEALDFAQRIHALEQGAPKAYPTCVALANMLELNLLRGQHKQAQPYVAQATAACSAAKHPLMSLVVKTLSAILAVDSGADAKGIALGVTLLQEYPAVAKDSDYIAQLQEALARAYRNTGNLERAEHYGQLAYQRAASGRVLLLQESTSETMATIKRAQGQLAAALVFYDENLTIKKRLLNDQVQKNLAYQRVKFDTQDKANQLALLAQRNQNLRIEKELHERQNENLILLLTLGLVLVVSMGGWLVRVLGRIDRFRHSAQADSLTRVSNRAHFVAEAKMAMNQSTRAVNLIVFDMDHFKHINDTYGHPTGDWVLQAVCEAVKLELNHGDAFGRLGGEEFALCIPDRSPEAVRALAERCRIAILSIDTLPSGHAFAITSSFGVATRAPGETTTYEQMLAAADKALYVSKNNGRNRVTMFHPTATSMAAAA